MYIYVYIYTIQKLYLLNGTNVDSSARLILQSFFIYEQKTADSKESKSYKRVQFGYARYSTKKMLNVIASIYLSN